MAITFPGTPVNLASARFTETSTTALFSLGSICWDTNGSMWQYVKCSAAMAIYEYGKVSGDGLFTIKSMTTTTNPSTEPASVGCVQVAFATNDYGWCFRGYGYHVGLFAASCVQDVKIYTTGTNGVVDDSATTLVNGLKLITTITGAASAPAWATDILETVAA